jgi:hypothetical protein
MVHDRVGRFTAALAVAGPPLVAGALVPFRGDMRSVNVALLLVLVVLLTAIVGGRAGGAVAALSAALAFDFFFTRPYSSLRVATGDDLETTILLFAVGLVAGELVVRARRGRLAALNTRREMDRMRRIAEVGAGSDAPGRLIDGVRSELVGLFAAERVWYEAPPFPTKLPRITHGRVIVHAHEPLLAALDPTPSHLVELPVYARGVETGRFVLEFAEPTLGVNLPPDTRATAVALADQLGVALAAHQPNGSKESS